MKTINAEKKEFVALVNNIYKVQNLEGKSFALKASKNLMLLQTALKDVEEKGTPSSEFLDLAKKVNEIANENAEDSKERIDKLEEENKELVETRQTQLAEVTEMLKEELSVELHMISEEELPENITAQQLTGLQKILE